jgi:type IV secretion system protein VirB1
VDLGYAQINTRTAERLGLTIEQALEPCQNLRAMQRVLSENYTLAVSRFGPGQQALQAALSMYNTGHLSRGLANGYVARVYQQATK